MSRITGMLMPQWACAALVNLYNALGSGWVDRTEEFAPRPEIADRK